MNRIIVRSAMTVVVASALFACRYERPSMWDLKCAACHDSMTVLNGKVVPGKDELRKRYRDLDEFANSCQRAPGCMNILKHDEQLFLEVGMEIGIPYAGQDNPEAADKQ